MPRLANIADKFTILRSVGIGNEKWEHSCGLYWLCGNPRTKDTPKYPMYGSVIAHERAAIPGLPTFVGFGHYYDTGDAAGDLRNNYLGPAYEPFSVYGDPNTPSFSVPEIGLKNAAEIERLSGRMSLTERFDRLRRALDDRSQSATFDAFQQQAYTLLTGAEARRAVSGFVESAAGGGLQGDA